MKSLLAVLLLASLVLAAAPKKRAFEVEVKVVLIEDGKDRHVGTSGVRFFLDPEDPQTYVYNSEGNSVTFDNRVRMEMSFREVEGGFGSPLK